MNQSRLSPKLIVAIILALVFGGALYLRIALPYDRVFSGDWVKFTTVDAYYHMRIVDNLVRSFPHHSSFSPYLIYPGGGQVTSLPFFDYLLTCIIWLVGLGSPTQHTVDIVGVYFPAVLGALTVIPVYFIGKELFNRWVGLISAGLMAILPGEFLSRSILGSTDHHVAETLFTTVAILFLILAIKSARKRQLTFNHLIGLDWAVICRPLIYSLLAGISLGIYLLTWGGALLFVFIIFLYFIIQFIIDHLRHQSTDYLCLVGVIPFFVALIMYLPVSSGKLYLASLIVALLTPLALNGISRLMVTRGTKRVYYPVALVVLGLAGLGIVQAIDPLLLKSMLSKFTIFTPQGGLLTVSEAQPLLLTGGSFLLSAAWWNFTTSFFLSFISLGMLMYLVIKRGGADKTLLLVWSLVILAATLGQRRFAYYFTVNVALLTGYLSVVIYSVIRFIISYLGTESTDSILRQILEFGGFREVAAARVETPKRVKKKAKSKKRRKGGFRLTASRANMAVGITVVFFLVFFPNISPAMDTASQARFAPSDDWCESLCWLKDNTPDPFDDPDFYYELHEAPFHYPETAYGVTAWWDYGYLIARIGHRLPSSNPGQGGASIVAKLFTAQDEDSANQIINKLNSKYVVTDHATATTKFHALPVLAGSSTDEFFGVYYYERQDSKLESIILLYPEYYRSLLIRLYFFEARQVIPQSTTVISYKERISREGEPYNKITDTKSFATYEEAEAYVSNQESDNYRIVSDSPSISPVPLEELQYYKLIYSSDSSVTQPGAGMISEVKVFEYTGD